MKYFAYGSNMALARLQERVPSARFVGAYSLTRHSLRFHKAGADGSGKCDAFFTGEVADIVEGVVFELVPTEIPALDKAEGLGDAYEKKDVSLSNSAGETLEAFTYVALDIEDGLSPFSWYKDHVLIGARIAALSPQYIAKIEALDTQEDPDPARDERERAIHGSPPID